MNEVLPPTATDPSPAELPEPSRVMLHMPVDVRSVSLLVLATFAGVFMLHWASAVFIPLMMGLLFSYALSPVVDWLQARRIPRAVSAAVLIMGLLVSVGGAAYSLSDEAGKLISSLPDAAQKLRDTLRPKQGTRDTALTTVQKAATKLEQAAEDSANAAPATRGVQRVQIEKAKVNIKDYLWNGTLGMLALLGQVMVVSLIAFFLLASGDNFRRKVVKLAGPTLSKKKVTLQAINEIHAQIQRFLLVQLLTSAMVGLATWLALAAVGLQNAAVWGIAAGLLNLVPYIGSLAITAGSALVGFMQFGTLEMAMVIGGISLLIHFVQGFLITPWLTSRANQMNPVAVFVGVLAWGWIWGIWGLLLGVPILVIIKSVCDRVEDLNAVGELLGR